VPECVLDRVAAGESSAVDDCMSQYGGLVWSLARRFCPDRTDAEDAVQEIFIEVWRNAGRFDAAIGSESTFVTMIARRRLIDRYRKRSRTPETSPVFEDAVACDNEQVDRAEIREEAARARRQMQRLRPEERRVLELSIDGGLSQSQIAEATNLPLGTVKTHARRGLMRLRRLLGEPSGIGPEETRA